MMISALPMPAVLAQNHGQASKVGGNFSDSVNSLKKESEGFIQAKEKYGEDEKDETAKSQYLEHGQNALAKSIDVLENRNNQLKKQLESEPGVYGDVGTSIASMLDADNQKLDGFYAVINNSTSTDALSPIASQLRDYRVVQQSYLKKLIILAHINQYENTAIKTAENRSKQLSDKIELIANQNKNISGINAMLSGANNDILQARQSLDNAKNLILQDTIDSVKITDIENYLSQAQSGVKSAYQLFKQIAIDGNGLFVSPAAPASH